jgi:hypothetical protein
MVLIRRDEGYWRQYAKVARSGLIALLILLSLPEVGLCQNKVAPKSQTENSQTNPQAPSQTPVFIHNPGPYEPHCASPPTREDAEYCQEWGATIAAQKQAEWAFYQLIASVVGIGAVIVTLVFTAKATAAAVDSVDASQRSADAAARAAEIAERALVDLERPFVYCSISKPGISVDFGVSQGHGKPVKWNVEFGVTELAIKNFGRTPAQVTRFYATMKIASNPGICEAIDPFKEGGKELPVGTICFENADFRDTLDLRDFFRTDNINKEAIGAQTSAVWVVGYVRYDDIFGHHHINGFALTFDMESKSFVRRGDAKYNYEKKEEASEIPQFPSSVA